MVMSCAALLAQQRDPIARRRQDRRLGQPVPLRHLSQGVRRRVAASGGKAPPRHAGGHARRAVLHAEDQTKPSKPSAPHDEPPPWPTNDKLKVVGKPQPRLDGRLKVTGEARYTADVRLPGMLFARRVVSPHPHARVKAIDTSAAERLPGVKAVHVVERNEGAKLRNPPKVADKYPLVRYAGQPVAGGRRDDAGDRRRSGAKLVKVDYEPLPFVVELDDARKDERAAGLSRPRRHGRHGRRRRRGQGARSSRATCAARRAATRATSTSGLGRGRRRRRGRRSTRRCRRTRRSRPTASSPTGSPTASPSTPRRRAPRRCATSWPTVFDLPKAKVRVITEFMGGGFGAKFGAGNFGVLAAQLSKKAGAPVRLMLDRKEEHLCVGNRPSTVQTLKLGAKKDGTLAADLSSSRYGTGGIATGGGVGWMRHVALRLRQHALGAVRRVHQRRPGGGVPRARPAAGRLRRSSSSIDELAEKLGMDPLALRDKIDVGEAAVARRQRRRHARSAQGRAPHRRRALRLEQAAPARQRHGRRSSAASASRSRCGAASSSSTRRARCACTRTARSSSSRRCRTSAPARAPRIAQVVAEELGLRPDDVTVKIGDTQYPIGPSSGGSEDARSASRRAGAQVAGAGASRRQRLQGRVGRGARATLPLKQGGGEAGRPSTISAQATPLGRTTAAIRTAATAACSSPRSPSTPRPASSRSSAWSRCTTAAGRSTRSRCSRQINGGIMHGHLVTRSTRTATSIARRGRMVNPNLEQYKIARCAKRRRRSRWCSSSSTSGATPPTCRASASRPTSRRRRRSPTPSTTPSACASASCR